MKILCLVDNVAPPAWRTLEGLYKIFLQLLHVLLAIIIDIMSGPTRLQLVVDEEAGGNGDLAPASAQHTRIDGRDLFVESDLSGKRPSDQKRDPCLHACEPSGMMSLPVN